jgi:hypothetical protein
MSVSVDLIMLGKLVLILGGFRQAFILFLTLLDAYDQFSKHEKSDIWLKNANLNPSITVLSMLTAEQICHGHFV